MGIAKGFLVVLASYAALALARIYLILLLSAPSTPSSSGMDMSGLFETPSVGLLIPFVFIPGVIFWILRAFIANQLSQRIFKVKADFMPELRDFGLAHFPLIFVGLSSTIIFVFGLSNIGIFASLFISMFFTLLMYTYFVSAVMDNHKLNFKKALLVIAITEAIIAAVMLILGLITLHPFMQNSLTSMFMI